LRSPKKSRPRAPGHLGLVVENVGRLGRISGGQHGDIRVHLRKELRESLDDQRVIVDH
jgi:hypothetical protein